VELDEATITKKKEEREIKLWENKLKSFKEKQNSSQIERKNLKLQQKKLEQELKDSKVRHKELQKEVDKMAKALKVGIFRCFNCLRINTVVLFLTCQE